MQCNGGANSIVNEFITITSTTGVVSSSNSNVLMVTGVDLITSGTCTDHFDGYARSF